MSRKILDTSCGPIDITETNRPQLSPTEDILSRLPYTLTDGVTATREGLSFDMEDTAMFIGHYHAGKDSLIVTWPNAAERLRYRDGEPWCRVVRLGVSDAFENGMYEDLKWLGSHEVFLHRLAAILCDDVEAFRVLHRCVTELGGHDE